MEGCESEVKDFRLSPEAMIMIAGSSKGTQPKYYEEGYWYKANTNGYEGLAEYLAGIVMKHSNVSSYVTYEQCKINGKDGCRSKSFLADGETFLSFERLFQAETGLSLADHIMTIHDVGGRIEFVEDFILNSLDVDVRDYLSKTLSLDALLLNSDRHFNNLGIVANLNTGEYRCAPVFDNGDSLLSSFAKYPPDVSAEENIENVVGCPFSASLFAQAKEAGITLKLDYAGLLSDLEKEPETRALTVLKKQLETYSRIIPDLQNDRQAYK
ncbi:MAG: hypothetical protein LUE16_10635 [Lachnospiraceae bacterium]|nr:hypothetical protein [Lachnospiraceae bacterium]